MYAQMNPDVHMNPSTLLSYIPFNVELSAHERMPDYLDTSLCKHANIFKYAMHLRNLLSALAKKHVYMWGKEELNGL